MSGRIDPSDYLLGELSAEERGEAERLMREDAAFRDQVERLRPVVEQLEELPAEAWDLEGPEERATPGARQPRTARRWRRPALAAAACLALLVAGAGIGALVFDGDDDAQVAAGDIDLRPLSADASGAGGTAQLDDDAGEAKLELSGLPPSPPSEYYELWLLDGPQKLVSLCSFRVPDSGKASIRVPMPVDPQLFRFIDVSVEPVDGGPEHSGNSVLRAKT